MPAIADNVFNELGFQRGQSTETYSLLLENHANSSNLPIFSMEGREYIATSLASNSYNQVITLTAILQVEEWRYAKIELDASLLVEVIFCPPDGIQNETSPPTLSENLLLDAWLGGLPAAVNGFLGSVLAKAHGSTVDNSVISALLSTLNCSDVIALYNTHPSFVDNKFSARIVSNSRFLRKQVPYSRLIETALRESDARWRFLQFYRVLEQGYLEVILDAIAADFLQDPKQALNQATSSIASEGKQLKNLVARENLGEYFEFILDDLGEAESNGNKFAFKINAKANASGEQLKRDRGAVAVYQIRCAIAHAGVRDIYYEQFPDADDAVGRILSTFEEAVFRFLGINLAA